MAAAGALGLAAPAAGATCSVAPRKAHRAGVACQAAASASSDVALGEAVRADFPILDRRVNGTRLVYLDNAATSQKPTQVLSAMDKYYTEMNSNVHRGVHHLSALATAAYEESRAKVAKFIHARSDREVVFTRGATEAINLVANSWGGQYIGEGDEIVLSVMEHHSNLVPWQLLAQRKRAVLKFCRLTRDTQTLDLDHLRELVTPRTKLVALVYVSNMLGCRNPVHDIVDIANRVGARVLLDACQAVPHLPVDVSSLGADWIVASSHKMCGPTGAGFLWGRGEILADMPPWMGGGEMIQDVFLDHSTFAEPPGRFEAGTPAIAEAIGMGAACDYLTGIGMDKVHKYEEEIGGYLYQELSRVDGVTIYGPPPGMPRASLCSFNVDGLHATDVSTILDQAGVAVRSGHHCTQPLHAYLGVNASARASAYLYNTHAEVDAFVEALKHTVKFFREMGV